MSNGAVTRWIVVWLLTLVCFWWASLSEGASTDPRLDMVTAIKAMGPHFSLGAAQPNALP